ncbi:uncharacterized protein LOC126767296 [Bactrocera neohumeralis]|uniref:uncharacterized protein LOC126767296 n=1 Tax=Bactrocera neohumeralis TaxID=98809 RepID=UPI0021669C88|nr:uncharacterized protein LOC126767296 [Bactrocera neohumeralis]
MHHVNTSPHVVRAYCPWFDCQRRVLCLPQEHCDESLWDYRNRLAPAGIPGKILCSLLLQCLMALADLERGGVVHNDIKPPNILLVWPKGRDVGVPQVKLADFGLSSLSLEIVDQKVPNPVRTPYYMAPETVNTFGRRAPHARDIWSLGCTFYELIVGVVPFKGSSLAAIHECATQKTCVRSWNGKRTGELRSKLRGLVQTMFTLVPEERPTPRSLQQKLSTLCTHIDLPVPAEAGDNSYARYRVCRPHLRLPVFTRPVANVAFATGKTFSSTNHNIIAKALRCPSQGRSLVHLPRPFNRYPSRSPGDHALGCDDAADAASARAQTVPAITSSLSRRCAWSPPPPSPASVWVHVVFPYEGYCQLVLGGQHVLHVYEDAPFHQCPPLSSGDNLSKARATSAAARAFPPPT